MIRKYFNGDSITGSSRQGNEASSYLTGQSNFGVNTPNFSTWAAQQANSGAGPGKITDAYLLGGGTGFWGNYGSAIGTAASAMFGMIGTSDRVMNSNDELSQNVRTNVNNYMMLSGNPWLMAAGATNTIIDKTGGFTDASKGLGGTNDTANFIASLALPGAGWFTSRLPTYTKSLELANSTGYTGTSALGDKVAQISGGKYMFGRSKARKMINDQIRADHLVADNIREGKDALLLGSYLASLNNEAYNLALRGGYDLRTQIGRKGMKLKDAIISHKNGGTFNIIPTGALHARLHHMENAEGLTKKGIPVVDKDGNQLAEIEQNEIIFRKEVTDLIESLREEGTDEAAIKAGKLLVDEIFNNTKDYTGMLENIDKLAKGGTIKKGGEGLDVGMIMDSFGGKTSSAGGWQGTANVIANAIGSTLKDIKKTKEKEQELDIQKAWEDYRKQMLMNEKNFEQALSLNQIQSTLAEPVQMALEGDKIEKINKFINNKKRKFIVLGNEAPDSGLSEAEKAKVTIKDEGFTATGNSDDDMDENFEMLIDLRINDNDLNVTEYEALLYKQLQEGKITFDEFKKKLKVLELLALQFLGNIDQSIQLYFDTRRYQTGGIIEQLSNLSPLKMKELENILKYLNTHD